MREVNYMNGTVGLSLKKAAIQTVAEMGGGTLSLSGIEHLWYSQSPVTLLTMLPPPVDDRMWNHNSRQFHQQSPSLTKHLDIDLPYRYIDEQYL
jgi:hypothetical protein